jgi:hypothetical protein
MEHSSSNWLISRRFGPPQPGLGGALPGGSQRTLRAASSLAQPATPLLCSENNSIFPAFGNSPKISRGGKRTNLLLPRKRTCPMMCLAQSVRRFSKTGLRAKGMDGRDQLTGHLFCESVDGTSPECERYLLRTHLRATSSRNPKNTSAAPNARSSQPVTADFRNNSTPLRPRNA